MSVVGYGQVRGEGGGESESGCICALRVVYNTENPKKRGGSLFIVRPSGERNAAGRTRAAGVASGIRILCNEAQASD